MGLNVKNTVHSIQMKLLWYVVREKLKRLVSQSEKIYTEVYVEEDYWQTLVTISLIGFTYIPLKFS